jgi:hypothetical protein
MWLEMGKQGIHAQFLLREPTVEFPFSLCRERLQVDGYYQKAAFRVQLLRYAAQFGKT